MDIEVRPDLIRQVQLRLRNDAGLSSYNPDDPTLPYLPSLRESVAGFDPSPLYLRCKNCQGRLLRGLQSAVCVFCGGRQPKDVAPDPIRFKSTAGYKWLLQSLELDGSDIVGPSIEENELNRGQHTSKDEISLSNLLNLEIKWPTETEESEHSLGSNLSTHSKSSLNLAGTDLDNFFPSLKRDMVSNSSEGQHAIDRLSNNVEIKAFPRQENLSSFQNVQHSVTASSSSEVKDNDGFSGWKADFQYTDSGNQHEASGSFDAFIGSTVDLYAHMDSVFGPGKNLEDERLKDTSTLLASATNDWSEDDLWNNSNFSASNLTGHVEATIKSKDGIAADKLDTPSSSVDWFPDDQWQTNSMTPLDNKTSKEDDSFDVWNDFASSTRTQGASTNSLTQSTYQNAAVDEQTSSTIIPGSTNNFQEMDFGSFSQSDFFSGLSNNQHDSVEVNSMQSEVHVSRRMDDAKVDLEGAYGEADKGDIFNSAKQPEADVESLLSQMHDLSFMLKTDLSFPSK
ncbi:uncharacterized protein LOC127791749 [Diospyros lotus]|uniref:uncharacterized protein LOC127791749 n=1 Tax=Diospyros lotus TaxID=55363 RepID=UPI00225AAF35|nr:uncharacterized protein LOC127791749 [Diospyros lotus]